jgi:hypothetical protein
MYPLLKRINTYLMRWARQKYKRLRGFKRLKVSVVGSGHGKRPDPVCALALDTRLPSDWMVRAV